MVNSSMVFNPSPSGGSVKTDHYFDPVFLNRFNPDFVGELAQDFNFALKAAYILRGTLDYKGLKPFRMGFAQQGCAVLLEDFP